MEQLETWLYGYPEKRSILETSIIQQKQQQIQDWILPIQERIETNQKIQNAVAQLNSTLIFAKQILQAENASKLVEISHLESEVNRWEKWLNTKWNEYIQKAPYEKSRTKILSIDQCDAATKTILNRITQLYKAAEQTTVSKQGDSYPANNNMSTNANTTQDQRNAMETSHDEL